MNFEQMLDDVYSELGETHKNKIVLPTVTILKDTTKITWTNINDFIKLLKCPPDHLMDYVKKNLHDDMNYDEKGLIIRNNRRKQDELSNIIRKYTEEFGICKQCKTPKTIIYKDNTIREWKVKCESCKSEYTI
jgi:translation initiation factor 2 subunit 2